jgi:hypothetical protein
MVPNAAFRANASNSRRAALWQVDPNGQLQPVKGKAGMSDGLFTELMDSPLNPGDRVATAAPQAQAGDSKKKQATGTFPGAGGSAAPRGRRF